MGYFRPKNLIKPPEHQNSRTNIRKIASDFQINYTIWKTLKDQLQYRYHFFLMMDAKYVKPKYLLFKPAIIYKMDETFI